MQRQSVYAKSSVKGGSFVKVASQVFFPLRDCMEQLFLFYVCQFVQPDTGQRRRQSAVETSIDK